MIAQRFLFRWPGLVLVLFCWFVLAFPAWGVGLPDSVAYQAAIDRPVLTLSELDRRMEKPVRQGGALVVDLKGTTIDLRLGNEGLDPEFAEQFYQRLQRRLNESQPLGLDLSGALVRGDFDLARLGLRVPAYGGSQLPALEAFNREFQPLFAKGSDPLARGRAAAMRSQSSLARYFLLQPQAVQSDSLVFQGPLLLKQTCFGGAVSGANLYYLGRLEAEQVIFAQSVDWRGARFARSVDFNRGQFQQESRFKDAMFAERARFNQASFGGLSDWQGSTFYQNVSFAQVDFKQTAGFGRSHWLTNADFDQAVFHEVANFQKGRFEQSLFLTEAQLEGAASFRQAQFQQAVSLRGARIGSQLDFGDARFSPAVSVNVADLDFDAGEARILGSPGYIGQVFSVPTLTGNETVMRSLVRNFRMLEQVADANQVEYTAERLRLSQLWRQTVGVSLNRAEPQQLMNLGLSGEQAAAVYRRAREQPFVGRADFLGLDEIDLATYLQVRDRITTRPASLLNRAQRLAHWALLASLLLLSQYGTNVALTFSVGGMATTVFALFFWGLDRYRRRVPTPIVPERWEVLTMAISGGSLLAFTGGVIGRSSEFPVRTLGAIALIVLPIPGLLLLRLYQQGRYHDLMDRSYFVQNGARRRLQVLIARLPLMPKFPFFRERYSPLPIDKRWNWLNYFDFSLNNWFKFGFNDTRLRDEAVPGIVSILVWYQWVLGIVYIVLLLWTFSRTIPGLNLLLYF